MRNLDCEILRAKVEGVNILQRDLFSKEDYLHARIVVTFIEKEYLTGATEFRLILPSEVKRVTAIMYYAKVGTFSDLCGKEVLVVLYEEHIVGFGDCEKDRFFLHLTGEWIRGEEFKEYTRDEVIKRLEKIAAKYK